MSIVAKGVGAPAGAPMPSTTPLVNQPTYYNDALYVNPNTGDTSTTPKEGYVFVPAGGQLQAGPNGSYTILKPTHVAGTTIPGGKQTGPTVYRGYETPYLAYKPQPTALGMAPDPFDTKIREAAMNDLVLSRKSTNRMSTFTTGPRGIAGPAKTVLG